MDTGSLPVFHTFTTRTCERAMLVWSEGGKAAKKVKDQRQGNSYLEMCI